MSCHYPRMLCHVFCSQAEYKIVCFIPVRDIVLWLEIIVILEVPVWKFMKRYCYRFNVHGKTKCE